MIINNNNNNNNNESIIECFFNFIEIHIELGKEKISYPLQKKEI